MISDLYKSKVDRKILSKINKQKLIKEKEGTNYARIIIEY
jgi:hypothetical protein